MRISATVIVLLSSFISVSILPQKQSLNNKEFINHFWIIDNPGSQALKDLDWAINNSSQIPGTMNKYTVGQTAIRVFDIFDDVRQSYENLSIPLNYLEKTRNYLIKAKENMITVYSLRSEAVSDLVEYLNYGDLDYKESFENKISTASKYYTSAKDNLSLFETEVEKLDGIQTVDEKIFTTEQTYDIIDTRNDDITYKIYLLSNGGISLFDSKKLEMSPLIYCPNKNLLLTKSYSPDRSKLAFAIIDSLNNTRLYVLNFLTNKYYYLKNNSGITPINLVWKDEDNLYVNTYTEKYDDGIYIPQNPWTELIDIVRGKVITSFKPASGSILASYLDDLNYLVYYNISTSYTSNYVIDYYLINFSNNLQVGPTLEFKPSSQVEFFRDKKLFRLFQVNTTDEDGNILSTANELGYRYFDDENSSMTVFDLTDNPQKITYYPELNKITCLIHEKGSSDKKAIAIYNSRTGDYSKISVNGTINKMKLSPSGNNLLYYDTQKNLFIVKDLNTTQNYAIEYSSLNEEWIEENNILLSNDTAKTFRLYNLKSKSYVDFSYEEQQYNIVLLGYTQQ